MDLLKNPLRGEGLPGLWPDPMPEDPAPAQALLAQCPKAAETPLTAAPGLARAADVGAVHVKDERGRLGLGSFKALGAAYVIARRAEAAGGRLEGETFVTASAGNHGLSLAAGARVFGADAVVYLAETVPADFAKRLERYGARVVVEGADYEASMAAAEAAARAEGWTLLSDSTWPGCGTGRRVMEGYLVMCAEAAEVMPAPPTHIFLQAGVGGLAAACAAHARRVWGDGPVITVVEPAFAPALLASIHAGGPVRGDGPDSIMGRLDCKEPSHLALHALARDADWFMTVTDDQAVAACEVMAGEGLAASPSGGAGFAGLTQADRTVLGLVQDSRVLLYLSEGPIDD